MTQRNIRAIWKTSIVIIIWVAAVLYFLPCGGTFWVRVIVLAGAMVAFLWSNRKLA